MAEDKSLPIKRYPSYPEIEQPSIVFPGYTEHLPGGGEVHFMDYWRVIVNRRWTIFAILFTSVAITLIWTLKQVPIYRATAALQIDRENPNVLAFKGVYEIESTTDDSLRTQFEVLKSRSLARRVIEELKLDQNPEFQPGPPTFLSSFQEVFFSFFKPDAPAGSDPEPDRIRPAIDSYLKRLTIEPVRQARLVRIGFESDNPQIAARVINVHAEDYRQQNLLFKWEASQQATKFLEDQLVSQKSMLEKSRDDLQRYSEQNNILFTAEGANTADQKLRQLQEALTVARNDRFRKESSYQQIHGTKSGDATQSPNPSPASGDPLAVEDSLPQMMSDPLIASLTTQLAELNRDEASMTAQFGDKWDAVIQVRKKITQANKSIADRKKRIIATIDSEYEIAKRNEDFLTADVAKQTDVVNKINQELGHYEIMKKEVETTEQMYQGLLNRSKEAAVSAGLNASNIRIVDRAEVPNVPVRPRKTQNMLIGILIGLVLGIGLAFFRDYLDDTFKSAEEIAGLLNVPALGIVPKLGSIGSKYGYGDYGQTGKPALPGYGYSGLATKGKIELVTHENPGSVLAEAYRSIRTSLMLSQPDHPPKTLIVTSALASEGKSVTAVNLAISLTQTGARVAIVDADMRKPRLHTIMSMEGKIGLSSFLTGAAPLKDIIHESTVPNLFVVPCGITPPNPGELLLSDRFKRLMDVLADYFEYVVVDSPPLNLVSDARVLATNADGVLLVIRASSTSKSQVRQAVAHLSGPNIRLAGIVLNDLDLRQRSYYNGPQYYSSYSSYSQSPGAPRQES